MIHHVDILRMRENTVSKYAGSIVINQSIPGKCTVSQTVNMAFITKIVEQHLGEWMHNRSFIPLT